jgi:phosphoglucomutase
MTLSPLAGQPAGASPLVDVSALLSAYYDRRPDPSVPAQRVAFGTSGHRGSSFDATFNEWHILAISQAVCLYRASHQINGPLFVGMDTHALSQPALHSALEVFAANGVNAMLSTGDEFTPTPAISHAILRHNHGRANGLADGIVITPSHNRRATAASATQRTGALAELDVTRWIENAANGFLANALRDMKRMPFDRALRAPTTGRHDYLDEYTGDIDQVIDVEAIRGATLSLGVDPLGGAGVHYWHRIAEWYHLNLTSVNDVIDPTFAFMTLDWDGQIRMDPSSPYAMRGLIALKDRFDLAFACDTDHDRHGIVTKAGLLQPNHYLSAAIFYLFQHRPRWRPEAGVGKTIVSSAMIDKVAASLGRPLYETPVGFKWFVNGLLDGSLGFGGEESAGASCLCLDGTEWSTDKDGIVLALLAAEMTARMNRDPAEIYRQLTQAFGDPHYERIEAPATPADKAALQRLSPDVIQSKSPRARRSRRFWRPRLKRRAIGREGIAESGRLSARPSGTESVYKISAESFRGADHLRRIQSEAQVIVDTALGAAPRT